MSIIRQLVRVWARVLEKGRAHRCWCSFMVSERSHRIENDEALDGRADERSFLSFRFPRPFIDILS